jgi:hypothetical protein
MEMILLIPHPLHPCLLACFLFLFLDRCRSKLEVASNAVSNSATDPQVIIIMRVIIIAAAAAGVAAVAVAAVVVVPTTYKQCCHHRHHQHRHRQHRLGSCEHSLALIQHSDTR